MSAELETQLSEIREQARRLLTQQMPPEKLKTLLDQPGGFDRALWQQVVEQGWPAIAIPEAAGGLGLGWAGLCVLSEELGRLTVSLPLMPGAIAALALLRGTASDTVADTVARLCSGSAIACLALCEPGEAGIPERPAAVIREGRINGSKAITPYAAVADLALVLATRDGRAVLAVVALDQAEVERDVLPLLDNARAAAALHFSGAQTLCVIDAPDMGPRQVVSLAALVAAFEQIGGAEASIEIARDYALQRKAFGQQIGRFQGIKHKLATMYCRNAIARGCALDALEAVEANEADWLARCSAARVAAIESYELASRESIQVHAGIGVTWEAWPHHHYRRSRVLALELGSRQHWRERLLGEAARAQAAVPASTASSVATDLERYRERARSWLAQQAPRYSGKVREGLSFEEDLKLARAWQALKAGHGYASITLPTEYGGAGGSELEKLIFSEEEMRYALPLVYFSVSLSNPVPIFLRHAPEAFRRRLGPPSIRGELIWCQLFSEPAAGSDLAALKLRAERKDGGWLLNGQKLWTSWAQIADWGVIVARTDPNLPKHAGLTYFFLDMKSPGVTVRPVRRLVGERDLNEVYFDDVFVPDEQRLGGVGEGFRVAVETLMIERYSVTDESGYAPTLGSFIELAQRSELNGRPAIEDGEIRAAVVDVYVERQGLRSIHRNALKAFAAGREPGPEGAIRKLLLGVMRQRIAALALDLQGASGAYLDPAGHATTHYSLAWLDPSLRIAGGTDEILLNTLAERVLGLPQDYRPDKGVPFNQIK